jgi:dTDP-D-glucose 4,6-dehydratase
VVSCRNRVQVGEDGVEAAVAEHIVFVPDRPFNDVHYHLDSSKLARLGWVEEVAWDDGLKRTLDWCVGRVRPSYTSVARLSLAK